MEATELRIGNYVFDSYKKEAVQVWGLEPNHDEVWFKTKSDNVINDNFKYIEPAILTVDWLLSFGFIKNQIDEDYLELKLDNGFYLQAIGFGLLNAKYDVILTDFENNELTVVTHVHKLQNLYFALMGKEIDN